MKTLLAWSALVLVLGGAVAARADPASGHLLNAAALLCGAGALVRGPAPRWGLLFVPLGCAAWGLLQLASGWTSVPFETLNAVAAWFARAAVAYAAYATFETDRLRRLLGALEYAALAIAVANVCGAGPFANRDHYAAFIELIFPIAAWRALRGAGFAHSAIAGFLFASVVACGSRAGTGIVIAEAIFLIACADKSVSAAGKSARATWATLAACMILFVPLAGAGHLWERLHASDAFGGRREMLVSTWHMIEARPATGFGLGTWPEIYPAYAVFDPPGIYMNHAHNDWAEWASEGGIPMALLLLCMAVAASRFAWRSLWGLGVPAVLLHAAVDFPMHKAALAIGVFYLFGLLAATHVRTSTQTRN